MDIPSNIVSDYRVVLGLGLDDPIPPAVLKAYDDYAHMNDVAGAGPITPKEMVLIALIAGAKPKRLSPAKMKKGDKVTVLFADKEVNGTFISLLAGKDSGKAKVKVHGDSMDFREIPVIDITAR